MAVMSFRRDADLSPLKTNHRHHVGIRLITGLGLTFADALFSIFPALGDRGFGVVGNGPEIQSRTVACIIASISKWVKPLTLIEGKGPQKCIC